MRFCGVGRGHLTKSESATPRLAGHRIYTGAQVMQHEGSLLNVGRWGCSGCMRLATGRNWMVGWATKQERLNVLASSKSSTRTTWIANATVVGVDEEV